MRLENVVLQARDAVATGQFWTVVLGLDDGHVVGDGYPSGGGYEARLNLPDGLWLDVCVEPVSTPPTPGPRLHLDLRGGARQADIVARLRDLGAVEVDIGQGQVPWVVLADPDGNPFCVLEERPSNDSSADSPDGDGDTGPLAARPLASANPERDGALYAALTGWVRVPGPAPVNLRHPSLRGPVLELMPQTAPRTGQNRLHLDIRPEPGDPSDAELVDLALSLGATRATEDWAQGHPWTVLRDTSGNEFCILSGP